MIEKIQDFSVRKLKAYNLVLAVVSLIVSMGLTSLVIALKFNIFGSVAPGARWTGIALIMLIVVIALSLRKVKKFIDKMEHSELKQAILLIVSLIPHGVLIVLVGLLKNHFDRTMDCIEWLILLFVLDRIVLYFKSFFEYELEIVKKAKEAEKIDRRRANLK